MVGGFVVFLSILISFVILPLFIEMVDRAGDLVAEKRNLDYLTERVRVPDETVGDLGEILGEIRSLYVDPRRPVDEILFLERLAVDNGLEMDVNIAGPRSNGNWSYLIFAISVRGDSDGFHRFVESIQNARWIDTIERLNVRRATERDMIEWEGSVLADISLNLYFRE